MYELMKAFTGVLGGRTFAVVFLFQTSPWMDGLQILASDADR